MNKISSEGEIVHFQKSEPAESEFLNNGKYSEIGQFLKKIQFSPFFPALKINSQKAIFIAKI